MVTRCVGRDKQQETKCKQEKLIETTKTIYPEQRIKGNVGELVKGAAHLDTQECDGDDHDNSEILRPSSNLVLANCG